MLIINSISRVNIINKSILAQDNLFILESKPNNIVIVDNPNLSRVTGAAGKDYVIIEGNLKKISRIILELYHTNLFIDT